VRFAEVINEGLEANNLKVSDIDMLIPSQFKDFSIQKKFELSDDQCIIIFKSTEIRLLPIPIALTEAWEKVKSNQEIP
jgi:3-oxoacyl-[acyl-carrier-protein] synthase-3